MKFLRGTILTIQTMSTFGVYEDLGLKDKRVSFNGGVCASPLVVQRVQISRSRGYCVIFLCTFYLFL